MKTLIGALALAIIPAVGCAQPSDQTASGPAPAPRTHAAPTLQPFLKRQAARLLARDTDGDGRISQVEFIAPGGKGDPAKRFAKIDRNADGMLDTAEIDAILTRRFTRLDSNGDGVLSADERAVAPAGRGKATGDLADS